MLFFCPLCGTMLMVEERPGGAGYVRFHCRTCPYVHDVRDLVIKEVPGLKRKQVDDVMGGDEHWELADSTQAVCPRCEHTEAYFFQIQTRSADEPATLFFRCKNKDCGHQWKDN